MEVITIYKKTFSSRLFDTFNIFFLLILMCVSIYPFWYIVMSSFSDADKLFIYTGIVYKPVEFSLDAYKRVLENADIYIGYKNTMFYVFAGTIVNLLMTSLGAYCLSKKYFYWNKYLMKMVLVTMFFSGGLIPTYLVNRNLGLVNNPLVLILPVAINTWNLIILRTAFMGVPDSLEEAAKIDGANDLFVLFRIVLPLTLPTLAVITLYYGVSHWNSWFHAMIYLTDRKLYPLQLFLREILIINNIDNMSEMGSSEGREMLAKTIQYATIVVATVPILTAYPFLQKYFVKGVMVGALKG